MLTLCSQKTQLCFRNWRLGIWICLISPLPHAEPLQKKIPGDFQSRGCKKKKKFSATLVCLKAEFYFRYIFRSVVGFSFTGEDERWGMLTDVLTQCCLVTVVPHSGPSALKLTLIWINSRASICNVFPVNPWTFPLAIFGLFLSIQSPVSHHASSSSLYQQGDGKRTLNLNPEYAEWQTYMDDSVSRGKNILVEFSPTLCLQMWRDA